MRTPLLTYVIHLYTNIACHFWHMYYHAQDLQDFCEFNSIELLPYVVERRKDDVPLSIKEVAEVARSEKPPSS